MTAPDAQRGSIVTSPRRNMDDVALTHIAPAYRLARWRVRSGHEAEEIVLEAVRRARRDLATCGPGDGRAWFLRIVSETCRDHQAATRGAAAPAGGRRPDHTGADAALEDAMATLPDELREVLVLSELEGLSYDELAEVMNLPVATAMRQLSRARQAMADVLFRSAVAV